MQTAKPPFSPQQEPFFMSHNDTIFSAKYSHKEHNIILQFHHAFLDLQYELNQIFFSDAIKLLSSSLRNRNRPNLCGLPIRAELNINSK